MTFARAAALLLMLAVFSPVQAGERRNARVLMSEDPETRAFQEQWGFADAIVSGDEVRLSGVVVGFRTGEDLETAFERAFMRMGETLARAGAGWDDVVDITSFHTDVTTQMPAMVAVKNRYVNAPFPTWTAIGVSRLVPGAGIAEIKLVARLPRGAASRQ